MSNNREWLGFDPNTTEASESFEGRQDPIPNGRYKAVATSAQKKHTKSGNGWFWELVFTIAEGEYEGRTVIHRFNMANNSDEAVAIGRSHMKRYLDSIGNLEPKDEDDLCHVAIWIDVVCKKSKYTGRSGQEIEGINNEITKIDPYFDASSKEETPAKEQSNVPPWKRK
jgi:hypothetical protein